MELSFIYCCCVCYGIVFAVSELLFLINTLSLPYFLRGFANFTGLKFFCSLFVGA